MEKNRIISVSIMQSVKEGKYLVSFYREGIKESQQFYVRQSHVLLDRLHNHPRENVYVSSPRFRIYIEYNF